MSSTSDGGRTALAGYLYQLLGAPGIVALASISGTSSDDRELETLLTWIRTGDAFHESLDQDLGIYRDDQCVLVQFKFSRLASPPAIGKGKLEKIAASFNRSTKRATDLGHEVTGYVLVTNRLLGDTAKEIQQAAKVDTPYPSIDESQRRILQQLRIVKWSLSRWEDSLRSFAHELGVYETEVDDGISRLVGDLFRKTAQEVDAPVDKTDIVYAFTGHRLTRPLTLDCVARSCIQRLDSFSEKLGLCGEPVRRHLLDEIEKSTSERALIVLCGVGGCGKTVALWQLATEMAAASIAAPISLANSVPRLWIADTICDWADLPKSHPRRSDQTERALARMYVANPAATPPIVCWTLDGLDEVTEGSVEREQILREVLEWFWKEDEAARQEARPPKVTLVVTCRDAQDLMGKWLRLDISGFGYRGEDPLDIEVSDFSSDELLDAAKRGLLPELSARVERALQPSSGSLLGPQTVDQGVLLFRMTTPYLPAVDEQVIEALKHPTMWRALLELDPTIQSQIFDGDYQAIHKLAKVYVDRFCSKVISRNRIIGLDGEMLLGALHTIAHHCQKNGRTRQSHSDWLSPVREADCGLEQREARTLYSEAISGGMIEQDDSKHWYWRHNLVWDYLAETDRLVQG